ncbi:MAG: phenylacetate-CoA oxygenase subunit PaaJ [Comamonadaceae bacterium]|nr:MAG: phenylacetate-CoA oxygenase subunit PaaJ [Comamonadaceae bacterium]
MPTVVNRPDAVRRAWAVLADVPDPEVPAISVCDLGIVREVIALEDDTLEIVLTPTYSGCPATEVIEESVVKAIVDAGLGKASVRLQRAPAWTTDWITPEGREKLRAYGIAPPGAAVPAGQGVPLRLYARGSSTPALQCPRCDSFHTEQLAAFGSTACKALYRCLSCKEPFEHFKPI